MRAPHERGKVMQERACELRRIRLPRPRVNKPLGQVRFLRLSRPRDDAELLHHAKIGPYGPVFHNLSIGDAHDVEELVATRI